MRSTEPAGDVFLGLPLGGVGKNLRGGVELDQLAEIEEAGVIGAAAGLLHVVRDDDDRVVLSSAGGSALRLSRSRSDRARNRVRPSGRSPVRPPGRARCKDVAAGRRTVRSR